MFEAINIDKIPIINPPPNKKRKKNLNDFLELANNLILNNRKPVGRNIMNTKNTSSSHLKILKNPVRAKRKNNPNPK